MTGAICRADTAHPSLPSEIIPCLEWSSSCLIVCFLCSICSTNICLFSVFLRVTAFDDSFGIFKQNFFGKRSQNTALYKVKLRICWKLSFIYKDRAILHIIVPHLRPLVFDWLRPSQPMDMALVAKKRCPFIYLWQQKVSS